MTKLTPKWEHSLSAFENPLVPCRERISVTHLGSLSFSSSPSSSILCLTCSNHTPPVIIMKFSLATAVFCALLVSKVQAQCSCDPGDWQCIQKCVTTAGDCISSCTDDACYQGCIDTNWPGVTAVASATDAMATATAIDSMATESATDSMATESTTESASVFATASDLSSTVTEASTSASISESSASVLSTALPSSSVSVSVASASSSSIVLPKTTTPSSAATPASASATTSKPASAGVSDFSHGKVLGAVVVLACSILFAYL
ncbi:hypothetical protein BC938DRAFT_479134 [Jimgerdemannia flammicorona]|uniref:Uncharacterized protein n=1 Tax=Jimgerdemannia flammicorona TaxID=994334 RepID=A0A433QLI6_9FUNG|nr:hypothetical protein BC938DRAFT_479134 [Jimgerdemannia flammicorona]